MSDHSPVPPGALPGGAPPANYPTGPPLAPPLPPVPPGAVRPSSPWGSSTPPPVAGPPGRRPWVVVAAILAVAALLAATFAAFRGSGDDEDGIAADREPRERDDAPADPSAPTTEAPPVDDFDAVIAEIEDFVEQERGLQFLEDVTVELADEAEFLDRLLADFSEDIPDLETQGRVLEALGLVEPGTNLVDAMSLLLGAGVVGFYDPATNELVVRGTSTSAYVRSVIAHELTHALDDQHFELDRPELEDVDELAFAFLGLVEGNANRVEDAYRATFTPAEEAEAAAEELTIGAGVDLFNVPLVLFDLLLAPYVLGPELVGALLDSGGQSLLDAAFETPPTTSEHLLVPDTFLADEGAVDVPAPLPDEGTTAIDDGVLGALGLAELLGASPALLPDDPVDPAVDGWGGDRYVAWPDSDGSGTCIRVALVGDTPDDTAEIADSLRTWAESAPFGIDATIDDAGPVTLTSCSA